MSETVARKRGRRGSPESWSVDAHVGQRVRMRRTLLGMSQEKLGEAIGLTFQQVQKYERGSNRISAGTLYRLGQVLDVPVSFFFDCYDDPAGGRRKAAFSDSASQADSSISRREARLIRLWRSAPSSVADEMLSLLSALSPQEPDVADDEERPDGARSSFDVAFESVSGARDYAAGFAEDAAATPSPDGARDGSAGDGQKSDFRREGAGGKTSGRAKAEGGPGKSRGRRRHGAVWDPADIYRAAKTPPTPRR